jgi:hypothetical protein
VPEPVLFQRPAFVVLNVHLARSCNGSIGSRATERSRGLHQDGVEIRSFQIRIRSRSHTATSRHLVDRRGQNIAPDRGPRTPRTVVHPCGGPDIAVRSITRFATPYSFSMRDHTAYLLKVYSGGATKPRVALEDRPAGANPQPRLLVAVLTHTTHSPILCSRFGFTAFLGRYRDDVLRASFRSMCTAGLAGISREVAYSSIRLSKRCFTP